MLTKKPSATSVVFHPILYYLKLAQAFFGFRSPNFVTEASCYSTGSALFKIDTGFYKLAFIKLVLLLRTHNI